MWFFLFVLCISFPWFFLFFFINTARSREQFFGCVLLVSRRGVAYAKLQATCTLRYEEELVGFLIFLCFYPEMVGESKAKKTSTGSCAKEQRMHKAWRSEESFAWPHFLGEEGGNTSKALLKHQLQEMDMPGSSSTEEPLLGSDTAPCCARGRWRKNRVSCCAPFDPSWTAQIRWCV